MGYYAADTHHGGNPSRLAAEFGIEFNDDLVVTADAQPDGRRHVFRNPPELAVVIDTRDEAHPLFSGVNRIAVMSSCSIDCTAPAKELELKSPPDSWIESPQGPQGPNHWRRQIIEKWRPDHQGPATVMVAVTKGSGRVVATGTWKLAALHVEANLQLTANIIKWLAA